MAPGWLDEIAPATSTPFVRMGTRALGAGGWLLGGDDVPGQLAEKERVLAAHHDDVVGALDGTEDAAAELLAALRRQVDVPGSRASPASSSGSSPGRHPIDDAGRLVAEDLCVLVPGGGDDGGGWILGAGSVCFPSHWRLPDKLGRSMAAVHDPVPDYAADLSDRVDRFLDKLRVGRGVWRRNWTVHTAPDLYAPAVPAPPDPPVTADDAGPRLWLRSERQTLTRLPRTGAIVFTIRTQQVPLAVVASHPDLRARLARAVAAWPPHQAAYRGGEAVRRPLAAWLAGPGRGSGSGPVPAT
ncbi:MAG TPA: DUF3445 domain-containing protein [Acidimicrobiales bacterium]|jgi:hypothetical protein|nr:DUF3445 domain-containing protein [Acidimicrobiales bacterium]